MPRLQEEGKRGGCNAFHVPQVAADSVGPAVAEEVGAEDGVAPAGEGDGDLLEHPAAVRAVAVGHEDGGFDGEELAVGAHGFEGLGEETWSLRSGEETLLISHSL